MGAQGTMLGLVTPSLQIHYNSQVDSANAFQNIEKADPLEATQRNDRQRGWDAQCYPLNLRHYHGMNRATSKDIGFKVIMMSSHLCLTGLHRFIVLHDLT